MQQDYTMANLVLQSVYPNNCILVDEKGVPSVMVKIPKITLADLGIADSDTVHPAFLVNGKEVDAIYLSKYSNTIIDGCAASMPAVDPAASIRIDAAMEACSSKGKGWHLMTRMEYALIAQICARNGFLPWGNNLHGRDYRETLCTAIASNDTGHRATGTGPLTWYHDRTYAGIADLNGNTSVWVGGVRLYYGELQILPDNDAVDSARSQADGSEQWKAVDGTTGLCIEPDGRGTTPNSLKLDFNDRYAVNTCPCGWRWVTAEAPNKVDKKRGNTYANTYCDETVCDKARELLKILALLPVDRNPNTYEHCKFFANNGGKDLRCHCGGNYHDHSDAGVFFVRFCDELSHATDGIGLRCSYIAL